MITFDNLKKEVFGIGITSEDVRAMRAGVPFLIEVKPDLDIILVMGDSNAQMIADLTTEEITPVEFNEYAQDGRKGKKEFRVRNNKLTEV